MAKHNKEVERTNRIDLKELENWFSDIQAKVMNQINKQYTGQVIIRIKCGKIENITNTEIIGATVLDNPYNIE